MRLSHPQKYKARAQTFFSWGQSAPIWKIRIPENNGSVDLEEVWKRSTVFLGGSKLKDALKLEKCEFKAQAEPFIKLNQMHLFD